MSEDASLWALFASSFLAATLLPGGSEAVLFGVLKLHPEQLWPALGVATLGNTLGGMSSYLIGRVIPQKSGLKGLAAALAELADQPLGHNGFEHLRHFLARLHGEQSQERVLCVFGPEADER